MCQYLTDFHDLSIHFAIFRLIWMSFPSSFRITILAILREKTWLNGYVPWQEWEPNLSWRRIILRSPIRTPTACCAIFLCAARPGMRRGKPLLIPGYPISPLSG